MAQVIVHGAEHDMDLGTQLLEMQRIAAKSNRAAEAMQANIARGVPEQTEILLAEAHRNEKRGLGQYHVTHERHICGAQCE